MNTGKKVDEEGGGQSGVSTSLFPTVIHGMTDQGAVQIHQKKEKKNDGSSNFGKRSFFEGSSHWITFNESIARPAYEQVEEKTRKK